MTTALSRLYRRVSIKGGVLLPGLLLSMAGMMHAASVTYTYTTPGYPNPNQPAPWAQTIAVPQIDVPGTSVTSIDFDLTGFFSISAAATNSTGAPATFGYYSDGAVFFFLPDDVVPGFLGALEVSRAMGGNFTVDPGPFAYNGPTFTATTTYSLRNSVSSSPPFFRPALNSFLGTGTVNLTISGGDMGGDGMDFNSPHFVGPGPFGFVDYPGLITYEAAQAKVTYNYLESVPEPKTAVLITLGLLALCSLSGWKNHSSRI